MMYVCLFSFLEKEKKQKFCLVVFSSREEDEDFENFCSYCKDVSDEG